MSLFIDADPAQLDAAVRTGVPAVEIHTGHFADAENDKLRSDELRKIIDAVRHGADAGLQVNAGHGLNYHNVQSIAAIPAISELNIGHAIIARALFSGMKMAVKEMKRLMIAARQ